MTYQQAWALSRGRLQSEPCRSVLGLRADLLLLIRCPAACIHQRVACHRCAVLNGAFLGFVVYSLFYVALDPFAGFTWSLFTGISCWLTATAFSQHVPHAWAWAIGVHALSWYAQIHVGHIMLEHRKPALLDSFFQVSLTSQDCMMLLHVYNIVCTPAQ